MYKVVITGANGFVAKNLRQYLSKQGFELVSISRQDFKNWKNETKIITKDYSEKIILPYIRNFDALIHLVGIGKQTTKNDYYQINLEFTRKAVKLCKNAKIKQIIFLSGLGVSKSTTLGYFISKYKSEQEILNSQTNFTIFRPSYIVGKDDHLSTNLKKQIRNREILIPGSGKFSMQPISIHDVTKIIEQSITHEAYQNQIIDLVGPNIITYENFVKLFAKKYKIITRKISLEKAYYLAINNRSAIFDIDDLNLLVGNFVGVHKKLKKISKIGFKSTNEILESRSLS